jgi:hypothetical protein
MKKLISSLLAAALLCSSAMPLCSSAEDDDNSIYSQYEAFMDYDYAIPTATKAVNGAVDLFGSPDDDQSQRWARSLVKDGISFCAPYPDFKQLEIDITKYIYKIMFYKYVDPNYSVISRDNVPENLDEMASRVMTEEDYEDLTANPSNYQLYFIDAAPVLARDGILLVLGNIVGADPMTTGTLFAGYQVMKMLDNIFFIANTEKEALNQIDQMMAGWGYWGVVDDVIYITEETTQNPQQFNGTSGDDKYIIDKNLGIICICDYCEHNSGNDTLMFNYDLSGSKIYFHRDGNNLFIIDTDNGNTIYIENYFDPSGNYRIENIVISDELTLTYEDVCDITNIIEGDDNDNELVGYPETSYIFAYEGNDTITSFTGNDVIVAEGGDDVITTSGGDNIIYAGSGNDTINSNTNGTKIFGNINVGKDAIFGDDGNDTITTNGVSSIVIGGKGDDTLSGGFGDDVYIYYKGDGKDVINESYNASSNGGNDIICFADLTPEDVYVKRDRGFTIFLKDGSGSISFNGTYQNGASKYKCPMEYVVFSDGTCWNLYNILAEAQKTAENALADGTYKQTADKNGVHYVRYVFVVPKSKIDNADKVTFAAKYNGTEKKIPATAYYTGVTSNGVQYTAADKDSVMLVVTITGIPADKEDSLTCELEF